MVDDDPAVTEALARGHGAWFGVTHTCPDGEAHDLIWANEQVHERKWLECGRCHYAVRMVVRRRDPQTIEPTRRPEHRLSEADLFASRTIGFRERP